MFVLIVWLPQRYEQHFVY